MMSDLAAFMKLSQSEGDVSLCQLSLLRTFQSLRRGFVCLFSTIAAAFSSAIDCEKWFVSCVNHLSAHFAPSEWECGKSIYFPKIAISLVYSMKMSLYPDEKKSYSNLFRACFNVIMRFCCTPAILIYLR